MSSTLAAVVWPSSPRSSSSPANLNHLAVTCSCSRQVLATHSNVREKYGSTLSPRPDVSCAQASIVSATNVGKLLRNRSGVACCWLIAMSAQSSALSRSPTSNSQITHQANTGLAYTCPLSRYASTVGVQRGSNTSRLNSTRSAIVGRLRACSTSVSSALISRCMLSVVSSA